MTDKAKDKANGKAADKAKAQAAATATEERETSRKEAIYIAIDKFVKDKTGKRIGKAGGREIFDLVVGESFAAAVQDGSFRFNAGLGSLRVKDYGAGSRRLPNGQQTTFGTRRKVRYEEGVVVQDMIGGKTLSEASRRGKKGQGATAAAGAVPASAVELD